MRWGDVEGVVVGDGCDARAQLDAARAHCGASQEQLGRTDGLPAGRVVLAAPELVVAQPVEVRDEVEISLQLQCGTLAERVVGGQERCELHRRDPTEAEQSPTSVIRRKVCPLRCAAEVGRPGVGRATRLGSNREAGPLATVVIASLGLQ